MRTLDGNAEILIGDREETEEQVVAFAKKALEQNELPRSRRDPYQYHGVTFAYRAGVHSRDAIDQVVSDGTLPCFSRRGVLSDFCDDLPHGAGTPF